MYTAMAHAYLKRLLRKIKAGKLLAKPRRWWSKLEPDQTKTKTKAATKSTTLANQSRDRSDSDSDAILTTIPDESPQPSRPVLSGLHTTPLTYPPLSSVTAADTYKLLSVAERLRVQGQVQVQDRTVDNVGIGRGESTTATATNESERGRLPRRVVRFHDQVTAVSPVASSADLDGGGRDDGDGVGAGVTQKKLRQERVSCIAMNSS